MIPYSEAQRCGAIALADSAVQWRVWAPRAERVDLVLINGKARARHRMTREEHGSFRYSAAPIHAGQRYAYCLDGGPERPDPASRWQPEGVHAASAVLRPAHFRWSDHTWAGIPRPELVLYELHVGTFTPAGTFAAIIPRLPTLRALRVTALELMPIAQFAGTRNWGYDGVYPYAPQQSYGGPDGLQRLVDACHAQHLALVLDVVYNHFGPEGCYVHEFGPYCTERYHTPWGHAINYDDRGSDAVRASVRDNVRMWLEDYHVEGLRLDAVHAICDASPCHILRNIQGTATAIARRLGRHIHIVAESDRNDVRLLLPPARGGYGLSAQWSDDVHHTVHAYLTGERQGSYGDDGRVQDFPKVFEETFVLNGGYSVHRDRCHGAPVGDLPGDRFVVCLQNHDQSGNRAWGERLGTLLSPPAQRLAASLLLLAPQLPLLFMGEEDGEEQPFVFFCAFGDADLVEAVRNGWRTAFAAFHADGGVVPDPQADATFAASCLTWRWEESPHKAGLRRLYQDVLAARQCWPALRDFTPPAARLLAGTVPEALLEVWRGARSLPPDQTLQVYGNLIPVPQPCPRPQMPARLWSAEDAPYHGTRCASTPREQLFPYACVVCGPATWRTYGAEERAQ